MAEEENKEGDLRSTEAQKRSPQLYLKDSRFLNERLMLWLGSLRNRLLFTAESQSLVTLIRLRKESLRKQSKPNRNLQRMALNVLLKTRSGTARDI